MKLHVKFRPVFLLAAAFVFLSPVSVATGLGISEPAKYARLLTTILIVVVGAASGRGLRLGSAGSAMTAFVCFFVLAGVWSANPLYALFYKGMFGLTFFSGLVLVNSVASTDEFKKGLNLMGSVGVGAAFAALIAYWRDPAGSSHVDRMNVFGLNANLLGESAAMLWILCLYLALNQKSRARVMVLAVTCCALALIIVGTGSRGAALMAASGTMFLLLPMTKRPVVVAATVLGLMTVLYVGVDALDLTGGDRFVKDLSKDTRTSLWSNVIKKKLSTSPLIGIGWLNAGNSWATVQSAYVQTLVETGVAGVLVLAFALLTILQGFLRNQELFRRRRLPNEFLYLNLALLVPVLLHGAFESSMFLGASLDSLFLGMGVGLLDRNPMLVGAAPVPGRRQAPTVRPIACIPIIPNRLPPRPVPGAVAETSPLPTGVADSGPISSSPAN